MVRCIGRQVERRRTVMTRISSTRSLKLASRDLNIELEKLLGNPYERTRPCRKGHKWHFPRDCWRLGTVSSFLSGAVEPAGAVFTPFGTAAMDQAQYACTCPNSAFKK